MVTALITHPDGARHVTPTGHPEQIARLSAVSEALTTEAFTDLIRLDAPMAEDASLSRAHSDAHLDMIEKASAMAIERQALVGIDGDTVVSPGSRDAARRAAGAMVDAVERVMSGDVRNAFCAMRPPGHHAERERAMGFCLYSTAAVGALHALDSVGAGRVAVVDFDVHHGNGTQDVLWRERRALFASTHEWPLYPGTGAADERGETDNVVNVPLASGTGSEAFREAWREGVLARVRRFEPDLIIISAGFDAHAADPLATLRLSAEDFAWATEETLHVAHDVCDGRVVSNLEGGYDLAALARSVAAHVAALRDGA